MKTKAKLLQRVAAKRWELTLRSSTDLPEWDGLGQKTIRKPQATHHYQQMIDYAGLLIDRLEKKHPTSRFTWEIRKSA